MKHQKKWIMMLAGVLAAGAVSAHAQVVINMGGSSAGTGFATNVPPRLFKAHSVAPVTHYINGTILGAPDADPNTSGTQASITAGRMHVWAGTLDGTATGNPALDGLAGVIRYTATGSADGIRKLQNQTAPTSLYAVDAQPGFMTFLDHTIATGCGAPVNIDTNGDAITDYQEVTGCTGLLSSPVSGGGNAIGGPTHLGASDTEGSSFGQSGPLGTTAPKQDQSLLVSAKPAVVPFKIVVGKGVKKLSDPSNPASALVPITNLTRLQVEAIFAAASAMGGARDWRRFDFVPDVNGDGIDDGGAATITLCPRTAGSGTKAAFDQTVMINQNEIGLASATVIFNGSSQDVVNCIIGRDTNANGLYNDAGDLIPHPLGIGYLDADVLPYEPGDPNYKGDDSIDNDPLTAGIQTDADAFPDVNTVSIDGAHVYDHTLRTLCGAPNGFGADFIGSGRSQCDPRARLIDGQYPYWVLWNLNRRPNGFAGISASQDNLMAAFIAKAGTSAVIETLSAGNYWISPSLMCVTKAFDRGPHIWLSSTTVPAAPAHCAAGNGGGN